MLHDVSVVALDYLGEYPFAVTVVPARVAYLMTSGSRTGMRRSIEEAPTRWAGSTEPILAVKASGRVTPWDT